MSTSPDWTKIDPAALALGISPSTLQKWHDRGWVPHRWRLPMVQTGLALETEFGEPNFKREGIPA